MKLFLERRLNWFAALTLGLLLLTAREMKHPVAAASPAVRPGHPRIWLTPNVLAHLRARAAAGSSRWLALKHVCDSSSTPTWDVGIYNYALAYQISGDPSYADRAIAL